MSKEAMKLALEALEVLGWQPTEEAMDYRDNAITALREALAEQPAQGCDHCNHPLYAGTKCKNCGRVTEQAAIKWDLTPEKLAQQEPVAWALEWTFNGEEVNRRLYDDETHCKFDAGQDGGVCRPLVYGDTAPPAQRTWVGLTHEDTYEATGTASTDLLDLAKLWSDNKIHVYQFDNEARKIIEAVVRRASAKLREKNA